MKNALYGFGFALLLILPMKAFGQEDTCFVPDLFGTGLYLNQVMAADTQGVGWKGASGITAWQNHTRVYVLKKNGSYPYSAQFNLLTNRKLVIRAENGNYPIPAFGGDIRPQIYGYPTAGVPPGRFVNLNQLNDTLILKNLSICGIDESQAGTLDKNQGNMIEIQSTGSGSIFIDSCVLKTVSGQIMQIGAGGSCHANVIQVTNTLIADMGFIGNSNLGGGRGFDMRNSEVDSLIVENCTFINFQDRVIRHYLSNSPIHSFKFNHNTVLNGMSYDGTITLGLIDSLGNGSFQIKNNLFVDNFAMGPDTDATRQSEFTDSPDSDPIKGFKMSWVGVRKNTTAHITPWVIANNYYAITDSGRAIRNLSSPYLRIPVSTLYPGMEEPIMTSDMKRQLALNGGDTTNAFRKINVKMTNAPKLMTRLLRWYYTLAGDGTGGSTFSNVGAGAGRIKDGTNNTPATHFIHDATNNVWVYDYDRRSTEWYMDSLDAGYKADVNLTTAATDGKVVGSTMWTFQGVISGVDNSTRIPKEFSLGQNYPNPFNPATKITYSVARQARVALDIFDILGRKVATLVNETKPAGEYTVDFDGSKLVSGVYVYRLVAPGTLISRKMLLVK